MPEDQEQVVTRRRTRRKASDEVSAPLDVMSPLTTESANGRMQDQPSANGVDAGSEAVSSTVSASQPRTTRRRTTSAPESLPESSHVDDAHVNDQSSPAPRRRGRPPKAAQQPADSAPAAPIVSAAPADSTSDGPAPQAAGRGRRAGLPSRQAADDAAAPAAPSEVAAQVEPSTSEAAHSEAAQPRRRGRPRRVDAPTQDAAPVEQPELLSTTSAPSPVESSFPGSDESQSSGAPRPIRRPSYRFGRRAPVGAVETTAPQETETVSATGQASAVNEADASAAANETDTRPTAQSAESVQSFTAAPNAPGTNGRRGDGMGGRPFRRADHGAERAETPYGESRESADDRPVRDRTIPGAPAGPGAPYHGRVTESGVNVVSRAPIHRQDRQGGGQRGFSRVSGPYMPGGRGSAGHQPAGPAPHENAPNGLPSETGGAQPYGTYDQYAPTSNGSGAPTDRSDRSGGAPNRPLRGRYGQPGYGNAPYTDTRGQRGPAGGRNISGSSDGYRDRDQRDQYREPYRDQYRDRDRDREPYGPASHGGRGMPPARSPYGAGDRGGDRRGIGGRGGAYGGRQGREPRSVSSYGSLYTNAPGGAPSDGRYGDGRFGDGRYSDNRSTLRPAGSSTMTRTVDVNGLLWISGGTAEILDNRTLQPIARVATEDVRRLGLRSGDAISGRAEDRPGRRMLVELDTVNDQQPEAMRERPVFEQLTASFPDRRIRLEHGPQPVSTRIIDLFAPLGFGSRALVVAPPKTGKTTLIREAAEAVLKGYPDAVVMAVLVGERPEEVTDLRARLEPRGGLVYAASFDEDTQRHAWLVQVAVERAKRVAESGRDAFMVLDSLTRLARAENLATRSQGRTLSGGIDAQALDTGRRAFGAARNLEEGGSITIVATCLVDTGSRQDEVVYEEFKGTGNMELHLSRELAQRRLFPAVDAVKSGTRREEMLLSPDELRAATALRRRLADLPTAQATQQLLSVMERTPSNSALLQAIEQSGWIK
ncbi:MAG: transcription termination factor Rho [Ktedonobacterales bacterium]